MCAKKIWNRVCIAAFAVQAAVQILTVAVIWQLDMLPGKYMVTLLLAFGAMLLLTGSLLFVKIKGADVSVVRRVIAVVLALVFSIGCAIVYRVVADVYDTIRQVTTPETPSTVMSVYVMKNDPAQDLDDAKDYIFGTTQMFDAVKNGRAVKALEESLGCSLNTQDYATVPDMVDALYNGEVGALILNSAYVVLLDENEVYAGFSEKTRILCDISVEDPVPEDTEPQATEPAPTEETVPEGYIAPFTVYISGMDTSYSVNSTSRSDVNILVTVNPQTKQVLLLNTPRDYYIPNPAGNGALDKLTHCGIYGVDCSIKALSDLYGVTVDHYARINFTGFETLINAVGGVTVYSDVSFTTGGGRHFVKGANELDGEAALIFSRERYHLAGGDNARGKNQMRVISALIQKITSSTVLVSNYAQILESLEGMFVTDMPSQKISDLVKMQLTDMSQWQVLSYAVTGANGSKITYSMPGFYASVMFCDDGMVAHGSELMKKVKEGQLLTPEDVTYKG